MRHRLLVPFLILGLASLAEAGEWVEGDGFRFRLPDGFAPVHEGQLDGGVMSMSLSLGSLGGDVDMEVRAFARDPGATTEAMLAVMRMTFEGDLPEAVQRQLDPEALQAGIAEGLDRAGTRAGQAGLVVESARALTIGAYHEGAEIVLAAANPLNGDHILRMAMTTHENSVYMLLLQGKSAARLDDDAAWSAFTTSVKLSDRGGVFGLVRKHWPFLAGGVLLVLAVVFLRPRGTRPTWPRATAPGSYGAGLSRAADGLPTFTAGETPAAGALDLAATGPRRIAPSKAVPFEEARVDPRAPLPEDLAAMVSVPLAGRSEPTGHEAALRRKSALSRPGAGGRAVPEAPGGLDEVLPTDVGRRRPAAPGAAPEEAPAAEEPSGRFKRNADFVT